MFPLKTKIRVLPVTSYLYVFKVEEKSACVISDNMSLTDLLARATKLASATSVSPSTDTKVVGMTLVSLGVYIQGLANAMEASELRNRNRTMESSQPVRSVMAPERVIGVDPASEQPTQPTEQLTQPTEQLTQPTEQPTQPTAMEGYLSTLESVCYLVSQAGAYIGALLVSALCVVCLLIVVATHKPKPM